MNFGDKNMKNYEVKNQNISLTVSSRGAEIQSVKVRGKEMIWQGAENMWRGKSPILFPVAGALKDKTYTLNGVEYPMTFHGFARDNEFELVNHTENEIALKLASNDNLKVMFPFDFEFVVRYQIEDMQVKVAFEVLNKGNNDMYFSFGSHESYNLYGNFNDFSLNFEKEENFLSNVVVEGALISHEQDDFGPSGKQLKLDYDLFVHNTVVFAGVNSRKVTLMHKDKKVAQVDFDAPNLLLWSQTDGPFICIEPWHNLPDFVDTNGKIENKPGIIKLEVGKKYINIHTVTYYAD